MSEGVRKGDLIELSFVGSVAGQVFDSTEKPMLVFAGGGEVVKGLDDALLESNVGESKRIVLAPARAFGERREDLVRLMPLEQFRRQGVEPSPGTRVELDGVPAKVQSVSGGRVRVDLNHELAGKTIDYEFKVEKKFVDASEKIAALQKSILPECSATLDHDVLKLFAPSKINKDADYTISKLRFATRCLRFIEGVKKVVVEEEYEMEERP